MQQQDSTQNAKCPVFCYDGYGLAESDNSLHSQLFCYYFLYEVLLPSTAIIFNIEKLA